jgi:hypothetical protein
MDGNAKIQEQIKGAKGDKIVVLTVQGDNARHEIKYS